MSLQPLQWRKLPVRNLNYITGSLTTNILLNVIYDMMTGSLYHDGSTRIMGSGSAWQTPFKFITGSNVEAVGIFPPTSTVMSQSVIFSGRNSTGASSSAIPPVLTGEFSYSSSLLNIACVKNAASQSFTQWTSQYPFGSSSYSTGYGRWTSLNLTDRNSNISLYESKEAVAGVIYDYVNDKTCAVIAGAIIDPEQVVTSVDAELDNRLYGIITSGVPSATSQGNLYGITSAFYTDGRQFLSHFSTSSNTGDNTPMFAVFTPQSSSLTTAMVLKPYAYTANYYNFLSFRDFSGQPLDLPLQCVSSGSVNYYLGRLRDITITDLFFSNAIAKNSSGNIFGYTLSVSEVSNNSALLFKY